MGEQLPHGNILFPVLCELGNVLLHRITQPHLAELEQLHHRGCGRDDFGERCHVEDGV